MRERIRKRELEEGEDVWEAKKKRKGRGDRRTRREKKEWEERIRRERDLREENNTRGEDGRGKKGRMTKREVGEMLKRVEEERIEGLGRIMGGEKRWAKARETMEKWIRDMRDRKEEERGQVRKEEVTEEEVEEVRRRLKNMIVMRLDKSKGELYCECPVLHWRRIRENVNDYKEVYEEEKNLTEGMIKKFQEEEYRRRKLEGVMNWRGGEIAKVRADAKSKDPENKTRIISSYRRVAMRKIWKMAGKGLTFMFMEMRKKVRHFTLHRLDELHGKLKKGLQRVRGVFGDYTRIETGQFDVKRMFTNLGREEIRKAVKWLFEETDKEMRRKDEGGRGMERRSRRKFVTVTKETGEVRWGKGFGGEDVCTFSRENLEDLVEMDLMFCYVKVGDVLMHQGQGAPIGGMLSRFYGDVVCAYQEWNFIKTLGREGRRVYGIRQVDDLLIVMAWDGRREASKKWCEWVRQRIRGEEKEERKVYRGGLEIEEEKR